MCLQQYGGTGLEVLQMTGPIITAICLALMRNALSLIRQSYVLRVYSLFGFLRLAGSHALIIHIFRGTWHPPERPVGSPIAVLFLLLFLDIL